MPRHVTERNRAGIDACRGRSGKNGHRSMNGNGRSDARGIPFLIARARGITLCPRCLRFNRRLFFRRVPWRWLPPPRDARRSRPLDCLFPGRPFRCSNDGFPAAFFLSRVSVIPRLSRNGFGGDPIRGRGSRSVPRGGIVSSLPEAKTRPRRLAVPIFPDFRAFRVFGSGPSGDNAVFARELPRNTASRGSLGKSRGGLAGSIGVSRNRRGPFPGKNDPIRPCRVPGAWPRDRKRFGALASPFFPDRGHFAFTGRNRPVFSRIPSFAAKTAGFPGGGWLPFLPGTKPRLFTRFFPSRPNGRPRPRATKRAEKSLPRL
jgi:hypothetical protein